MSNVNTVLETLKEKENLIKEILICISCGSDNVIRDDHALHCRICDYANSYEVTA